MNNVIFWKVIYLHKLFRQQCYEYAKLCYLSKAKLYQKNFFDDSKLYNINVNNVDIYFQTNIGYIVNNKIFDKHPCEYNKQRSNLLCTRV